jgi:hypothetical protein
VAAPAAAATAAGAAAGGRLKGQASSGTVAAQPSAAASQYESDEEEEEDEVGCIARVVRCHLAACIMYKTQAMPHWSWLLTQPHVLITNHLVCL